MKRLICGIALVLSLSAHAQNPQGWLNLLNAEPGRAQKLTSSEVEFRTASSELFSGLVVAGFKQSDGTLILGSLIWEGRVLSPLAGYAQILKQKGFSEASDEQRVSQFLDLLRSCNAPLGIYPYNGAKSREENRPQPVVGFRQADGQHRFEVWFCEEPGLREGPEWRRVVYLVNPDVPAVRARTLDTFHPLAEGLRDFPPISSAVSD